MYQYLRHVWRKCIDMNLDVSQIWTVFVNSLNPFLYNSSVISEADIYTEDNSFEIYPFYDKYINIIR